MAGWLECTEKYSRLRFPFFTTSKTDTASGNSVDWAYSVLGANYSYAVELPDTGEKGFLLLPEQITGVGEETYEAVKEMAYVLLKENNMKA